MKEEEIKRRGELEKLINQTSNTITTQIESAMDVLPARTVMFLDYNNVKEVIDKESNDIIMSVAEFYLDAEIIKNVPYFKQKTMVDKVTISSLLFQMKTAEHAIVKLLGEIDDGNLHPRTFEVLSALQKSKMEIVKHLSQFMITMENSYKTFQEDFRVKKSEDIDYTEEENNEGFKMRGTRQLIESLERVKNGDFNLDELKTEDSSMG